MRPFPTHYPVCSPIFDQCQVLICPYPNETRCSGMIQQPFSRTLRPFDGSRLRRVLIRTPSLRKRFFTFKEFMKDQGVLSGLHRDNATEQKRHRITQINRDYEVKESFSEVGSRNQNTHLMLGSVMMSFQEKC
jgi:hypothetical protein